MKQRRLPAEWEQQSGIMLTWPHAHGDWRQNLTNAETTFANIATQISLHELVLIVCSDETHQSHIDQTLRKTNAVIDNVRYGFATSNDTWARDHGPITVLENNNLVLLDFIFNGWGNKYTADLDNKITNQLYNQRVFGNTSITSINFILEGGSIESDGNGTLLTTTNCLLNPSRNPGHTRESIEQVLNKELGIETILWLENGSLEGDDTDAHIDTLARFCDNNTIAYVSCNDSDDEHFVRLKDMEDELSHLRNRNNLPYKLVPLPFPSAIHNDHGQRLPATYANFLIINGAVLVPTYNDEKDNEALTTIQACFPDRKIIGIDCSSLIHQFGSLHCVTMQLPSNVLQ